MKDQEKEAVVAAVLAQVEELDLEDRWAVLEQALEISTASKPPELKIMQDTDPAIKPRENASNVGLMVCWHNRYNLGDEQPKCTPQEWYNEHMGIEGRGVCMPLYLYDHSGITMSTGSFSCPWDSGQVGWIYASPKAISENVGMSTEAIEETKKLLEYEVKDYDYHLRGQVWGFQFGDDSCWGFVGDMLEDTGIRDHLPEEAIPQLEAAWEART